MPPSSLNLPRAVRLVGRFIRAATLTSLVVTAQQPTPGEKTRPDRNEQSYNAPGATYTGEKRQLLNTVKVKVVLSKFDLRERTLTVVPAGRGRPFRVAELGSNPLKWSELDELQMEFLAPPGLEKIKVSKRAAKSLGKKRIQMEELKVGMELRADYYPVRVPDSIEVAVREIIVEKLAP